MDTLYIHVCMQKYMQDEAGRALANLGASKVYFSLEWPTGVTGCIKYIGRFWSLAAAEERGGRRRRSSSSFNIARRGHDRRRKLSLISTLHTATFCGNHLEEEMSGSHKISNIFP
jgi:hypothetical protein